MVVRDAAEVHSAPFAVAPIVKRLDLNTTLTSDDQPDNGWRRVRLPNGTFGFMRDEELRIEAASPAPPPPAPAPPPPASTAPEVIAARVNVLELTARAQPDAAAPVLRVFQSGALLTVAPTGENGWRRTRLPDGQTAYAAEAGLDFGPAPQAARAPVQPLTAPPSAKPRAKVYIANLDKLEEVVAFGHQNCPDPSDASFCTKTPNFSVVIAGILVPGLAEILGLAIMPKRSDLFDVVNTWNQRHLDDQLTIESLAAPRAGGQLF